MRIIDADSLKETIEYISFETGYDAEKVINAIDEEPTIETVRCGKWVNSYPQIEKNPMFMYGICSLCGFEQSISMDLKFCPNCGAKMCGDKNESNRC